MDCNHEQVRCTNNVFYCLKCGARIAPPVVAEAATKAKAAVMEPPKRKTRKGVTKE